MYIDITKMSYNNYYQIIPQTIDYPIQQQNPDKGIDWLLAIGIGLGLTILILIIWYIWALNYRYSSDRIVSKMMPKYEKKSPEGQFLYGTEGSTNPARTIAIAKMNQRDVSSGDYITTDIFTLPILDNCVPSMKTCVSL